MILELPAKRSKEERVATLAPHYKQGYIYHNEVGCGKLEGQLLGFPRSKLWDVMDCLAYVTYVMDKFAIFFDPMDGLDEVPAEEYDELFNDVMMTPEQMGHIV